MSNDGKDLIKRLLTLDPKKRISSTEALEHPWMQDEEVMGKARKIMEAAARNVTMPPPPLTPVSSTGLSLYSSYDPNINNCLARRYFYCILFGRPYIPMKIFSSKF